MKSESRPRSKHYMSTTICSNSYQTRPACNQSSLAKAVATPSPPSTGWPRLRCFSRQPPLVGGGPAILATTSTGSWPLVPWLAGCYGPVGWQAGGPGPGPQSGEDTVTDCLASGPNYVGGMMEVEHIVPAEWRGVAARNQCSVC